MNSLLAKINCFLRDIDVRGATIVAAVSGGADSVALARGLSLLREEFGINGIVIAHVNHRLRNQESDEDEAFVRNFFDEVASAQSSFFNFECLAIDTTAEAKSSRQGIETTARRIRYRWLTSVARKHNARFVATGHSANDQAETILFRILRGTGIKGLRGIPSRRRLQDNIDVIRPMLRATRQEAVAFLNDLRQSYREDTSNVSMRFARNRIRHKLLPLLKRQFNSDIVDVLCRLGQQATEIFRDQEAASKALLAAAELPRAGEMFIFDARSLQHHSRMQIREMFRRVWEREGWTQREMDFREWDRIAAVVLGEMPAIDLPGRIRVRRKGRVIQIQRE